MRDQAAGLTGVDLDDPRRVVAARRLEPGPQGNAVLDRLCALAARLLSAGSAQVSLLTDVQVVVGGVGLGADAVQDGPTPREDSLCTVTARTGLPFVVHRRPPGRAGARPAAGGRRGGGLLPRGAVDRRARPRRRGVLRLRRGEPGVVGRPGEPAAGARDRRLGRARAGRRRERARPGPAPARTRPGLRRHRELGLGTSPSGG